jgi:hypothetical protein
VDVVPEGPVFCALVWARAMPDASTRNPILVNHLIEALSLAATSLPTMLREANLLNMLIS